MLNGRYVHNYQVILELGAQSLMGPEVVRLASEKSLSFIAPGILLCRKPYPSRSCGGIIFKSSTQKPPGENIRGAPRTKERKKRCSKSNLHV